MLTFSFLSHESTSRAHELCVVNPYFFARHDRGHGFSFEIPAVIRTIKRFACRGPLVKSPFPVRIDDCHVTVGAWVECAFGKPEEFGGVNGEFGDQVDEAKTLSMKELHQAEG